MDEKIKKNYTIKVIEDNGRDDVVMEFPFGGHHDLAKMVEKAVASGDFTDKQADELVLGMRLLHHVLKDRIEDPAVNAFWPAFEDFKHAIREKFGCQCPA